MNWISPIFVTLFNKNLFKLADRTNNIITKLAQSKSDLIAQWNNMGDNFMKKDPNFIKPRKAPGALNTYADATSKSVNEYLSKKDKKIKEQEIKINDLSGIIQSKLARFHPGSNLRDKL